MLAKLLATSALVIVLLSPASAQERLKVVATFSILADFAQQVGGNRVAVTSLVGPGGDAHVYEPRPADAAALGNADIVIANGRHFEGFIDRLIEASGSKAPVVEASKGASEIALEEGEEHKGESEEAGHHHHGETDPHAWQSVPNAVIYVRNIAEGFCGVDAGGCATYRTNADAYAAKLETLETELRVKVEALPQDRRRIITSHDAFAYLGKAYGLTFLAPEGVSTASEASAADVAALIRQAREEKVSAIFVESITDPRLAERIAAETGLAIGGELYSDALSGPDGPAATYVEMMRHNVGTITSAAGGS